MSKLKTTKNKLTVIFTIILASLFLIIWLSFFLFKMFEDESKINLEFLKLQKILKERNVEIIDFALKYNKSSKELSQNSKVEKEIDRIISFWVRLFDDENVKFWEEEKTWDIEDIIVYWKTDFPFFNRKLAIFNKDETILYSNIEDSSKLDFKEYLKSSKNIIKKDEIIIFRSTLSRDYKIIIFTQRSYSKINLYNDVWYLLLWIFIFSVFFYLIWKIFVNFVLKPVEENIEEMNNFIDNAGHELKTPLAVINSSSSLLKEINTYDPELVKEIIDETSRANDLIWALRSLANISKTKEVEKFFVSEIIKTVIEWQKLKAKEKNISVNFDSVSDFEIKANKNYFFIFISNLVSNAIKYNKINGEVFIEIRNLEVVVRDSGIWIPKMEINKIFERFYRVGKHRNREWFGLGLSIVEKIAKIYSWKINIESIEWIWTKIKINF